MYFYLIEEYLYFFHLWELLSCLMSLKTIASWFALILCGVLHPHSAHDQFYKHESRWYIFTIERVNHNLVFWQCYVVFLIKCCRDVVEVGHWEDWDLTDSVNWSVIETRCLKGFKSFQTLIHFGRICSSLFEKSLWRCLSSFREFMYTTYVKIVPGVFSVPGRHSLHWCHIKRK